MYDAGMHAEHEVSDRKDRRLTYEDVLLFPDDGRRHEIIDGEHYVTACPNTRHQVLLGRLHYEIETYLRQHPGTGRVFLSPLDVVFTMWDVVEPDLLFVGSNRANVVTDKNIQGAPSLVVEILSPATRRTDEHVKRRLFERGGVEEYWLVDPDFDVVTVFSRVDGGAMPKTAELRGDRSDRLTTRLLQGFAVELTSLFET